MKIETKTIETAGAVELYITALPDADKPLKDAATALFSGITDVLESRNAWIFQERVFASEQALSQIKSIRAEIYGRFDDGVSPTWLVATSASTGQIAGVQIHAVANCQKPRIIGKTEQSCGRILRHAGTELLSLSGIHNPNADGAANQAQSMLEQSSKLLAEAGTDFGAVGRTWMWLNNILEWYDDFNEVRNKFFSEHHLLNNNDAPKMPASTGIGIGPDNGTFCTMDLIAALGIEKPVEYFDISGNQNSAFDYGSAFSRAASIESFAGTTVFVSGTASIGTDGKTTNIGDAAGQIQATIDNVRAVFKQNNCGDNEVVQAIMYSKTPEIEKLFFERWAADISWPYMTAVTDICRSDLLFEIEATAVKTK